MVDIRSRAGQNGLSLLEGFVKLRALQKAIRSGNYFMLEKERCAWMGAWKQCKENNYLCLQAEYIELFDNEDFDP